MSQNWVASRTIFLTVHGSQAFGMATATSDLDLKGVCFPPRAVRDDLFHKFEQIENPPFVERSCQHLINPANPKVESIVYSFRKYIELAALVNPTIIELMWVDPKFIVSQHPIWQVIQKNRGLFLSRKARQTYLGYSHLNRWLSRASCQSRDGTFRSRKLQRSAQFGKMAAVRRRAARCVPCSSEGKIAAPVGCRPRLPW